MAKLYDIAKESLQELKDKLAKQLQKITGGNKIDVIYEPSPADSSERLVCMIYTTTLDGTRTFVYQFFFSVLKG